MKLVLLSLAIWLTACAQLPSHAQRVNQARLFAANAGWQQEIVETDDFSLLAFLPVSDLQSPGRKTATLTVYIEGDGLAWINSSTPSNDPTPNDPLALKLALRDDALAVYVARPCQFVENEHLRNCTAKYWTSHRFSDAVISATNQAIDQLKTRFGTTNLVLVGYSGGGAVASLVAARRHDVVQLISIAGNLDTHTWATEHHLSALTGSLNPADAWQQLQTIPQTHYVGGQDKVVSASVASAYASRFPAKFTPRIVVLPDFDHHCCWLSQWPALKKAAISLTPPFQP